jgi:hypothetical protein
MADLDSPPTTPRRHVSGLSNSNPPSPADEYRRSRTAQVPGARAIPDTSSSPIKSPRQKKSKQGASNDFDQASRAAEEETQLLCSLCGNPCKHDRKIRLGIRVGIALISRRFVRGLSSKLSACESCNQALLRAKALFIALEEIVTASPPLDDFSAPALRLSDLRGALQSTFKNFTRQPLDIELQLRLLAPEYGWAVLPALTEVNRDCGKLMLLKAPTDRHLGPVILCEDPVDRVTGLVLVHDVIDKRRFRVRSERLMPMPDPGVPPGVAAAPHAAHAEKSRLLQKLEKAGELVADLEGKNEALATDYRIFEQMVLFSCALSTVQSMPDPKSEHRQKLSGEIA